MKELLRPGIPKSSEALGFRKNLIACLPSFPSSFPTDPFFMLCIWFHVYPVLGSMPVSLSQSSQPASAQVEFPGLCCWRVRWKPIEVSGVGLGLREGRWADRGQSGEITEPEAARSWAFSCGEDSICPRPGAGTQRNDCDVVPNGPGSP